MPLKTSVMGLRERPVPPEIAWAQARFTTCLIADGSTLDALLRKAGLLRDLESHPWLGLLLVWFSERGGTATLVYLDCLYHVN